MISSVEFINHLKKQIVDSIEANQDFLTGFNGNLRAVRIDIKITPDSRIRAVIVNTEVESVNVGRAKN